MFNCVNVYVFEIVYDLKIISYVLLTDLQLRNVTLTLKDFPTEFFFRLCHEVRGRKDDSISEVRFENMFILPVKQWMI